MHPSPLLCVCAVILQMQAKRAVGKGGKNAKALAAMAALLKGLEDGEEVMTMMTIVSRSHTATIVVAQ